MGGWVSCRKELFIFTENNLRAEISQFYKLLLGKTLECFRFFKR